MGGREGESEPEVVHTLRYLTGERGGVEVGAGIEHQTPSSLLFSQAMEELEIHDIEELANYLPCLCDGH